MSQSAMESAIEEYLAECEERLAQVSKDLKLLESEPVNRERLDSIYRAMHTIKGSSQLFGFNLVGDVAHQMETSLEPLRKQVQRPGPELTEALFRGLDAIDAMVCAARDKHENDFGPLAAAVIAALVAIPTVIAPVASEDPAPISTATPLVPPVVAAPEPIAPVVNLAPPAPEPPPAATAIAEVKPADAVAHAGDGADSTSSVRVSVALLDKLMNLMGEMVLVRNQVLQFSNRSDNLEFLNLSQRLDVVTSDIQGEVMKTRMQPIGGVLSKFQRVVRELSRELGKKIELNLSGMETELDKTLLEAVKDPIMHIVRNACDHGLETPAARKEAGKSETGHINIRAFHEGGQIVIEIADDGRGLDRERLAAKAIEKGVLTPAKAATLTERQTFELIFAAGFSTAAKVTNVSGRGVGMDVVKSNIEGIGGLVDLHSQLGRGTTLRLKIPLTLAIVPAMIVRLNQERFVIPQVKMVELVRVEAHKASSIEYLQGHPVYRLRGNLLPLVALSDVLGLPKTPPADVTNIVVVNAEGLMFGLIVDEVQDTAEVVVKPLSGFLKTLAIYGGATVLGDGAVALILDVVGIAQAQRLLVDGGVNQAAVGRVETRPEEQEFLLCRVNSRTKHAIPLNLVHRLEEFPRSALEHSGARRVLRYRGTVLPLISANEYLKLPEPAETNEMISVIVSKKNDVLYGIEVAQILDVLSTTTNLVESVSDHPVIIGNLVHEDGIIVVIDILRIMDELSGDAPANAAPKAKLDIGVGRRVLFAEDTVFFRKHVTQVLVRAGFEVITAEDGKRALEILESNDYEFDVILSDIEMPRMNGIEFAQAVRRDPQWKHLPMIALTTKFNPAHRAEGMEAGFTEYLEKLKPEVLLGVLEARLPRERKPA